MDVLSDLSERCDKLRSPGTINLIVSIFILVGMLVSYLPQHYRIISRGTSEGISPYFVLLGVTSATSGFANILTLPQSRQDVACCSDLDAFHCLAGLLGIAQLGVQWISFAFILVLFLVFFRYDAPELPSRRGDDDADLDADGVVDAGDDEDAGEAATARRTEQELKPDWQTAVAVACACFIHGLAVIVITAIVDYVYPRQLSAWANSLGLMAAALAGVQYLPQIWTTYRLKHVGSLSIPMMCIQTPGGFLFAASLFARLGWEGWSSWGIFLLTATMQGILLTLGVCYELKRHGDKAKAGEADADALLDHSSRPSIGRGLGGGATAEYYPHGPTGNGGGDGGDSSQRATHPHPLSREDVDRQDVHGSAESEPLIKPGGKGGPSYRT